jgi:hypothetical protein
LRYNRNKLLRDPTYRLAPEQVTKLVSLLRPLFEQVPSLAGAIDTAEMILTALTDDQCRAVDILSANPRALCSGGAGTGKTFLAMEMARRALALGKTVTLCCSSPWLRHYLDARLVHPGLRTLHIGLARRVPAGTATTDMLVVDEAQDLMNFEDLDVLDKLVTGGLANGNWTFYLDSNNQTGLVGRWDAKALEYLASLGVARVPLTRNCRNTLPIVEAVAQHTGCDMGRQEQGGGPQVHVVRVDTGTRPESVLASTLDQLLANGVAPSDITVLSPMPWAESCASKLHAGGATAVLPLDDFSLRHFPPRKISFAKVSDFKGLENTAIVVVDIQPEHLDRSAPATLYVAMSRARAHLTMLVAT